MIFKCWQELNENLQTNPSISATIKTDDVVYKI